jgi:hypothetical protein
MALTVLDSVAIDSGGAGARTLMLCQGDLAQMSSQDAVNFIAVSALPGDYTPSSGSLIGALAQAGVSVQQQSQNKAANYEPTMPCWVSQDVTSAGLNFNRFILFEPANPAALAAFDVFMIFRALLCFTGGAATSIALPIVCTGSGGADFATILRQLFFMGAHWASFAAWPFSTIKLVVFSQSQVALAQSQFTAMKAGYLNPPLNPPAYPALASKIVADSVGADLPAKMTQRQYNCIRAYTGNIYQGVNVAMRKHDYSASDYIYWLPTIEAISSGLLELPNYTSPNPTLRGTSLPQSVINQYVVGATIDHFEFTSSSRDHPFPGNTLLKIMSVEGKDVSAISFFPTEDEVLYDYDMTDSVTAVAGQFGNYQHLFSSKQVVPNWCGS